MSIWTYVECTSHLPYLRSEAVSQHLELEGIQEIIANREDAIQGKLPDLPPLTSHHMANLVQFLKEHPDCQYQIVDEYGEIYSAYSPDSSMRLEELKKDTDLNTLPATGVYIHSQAPKARANFELKRSALQEINDSINDAVNHPKHYTSGNIEVWDFIIDQGLNYCRGTSVKYISRAGKKYPETEIEDLEKAIAYLNREVKRLKDKKVSDEKTRVQTAMAEALKKD